MTWNFLLGRCYITSSHLQSDPADPVSSSWRCNISRCIFCLSWFNSCDKYSEAIKRFWTDLALCQLKAVFTCSSCRRSHPSLLKESELNRPSSSNLSQTYWSLTPTLWGKELIYSCSSGGNCAAASQSVPFCSLHPRIYSPFASYGLLWMKATTWGCSEAGWNDPSPSLILYVCVWMITEAGIQKLCILCV